MPTVTLTSSDTPTQRDVWSLRRRLVILSPSSVSLRIYSLVFTPSKSMSLVTWSMVAPLLATSTTHSVNSAANHTRILTSVVWVTWSMFRRASTLKPSTKTEISMPRCGDLTASLAAPLSFTNVRMIMIRESTKPYSYLFRIDSQRNANVKARDTLLVAVLSANRTRQPLGNQPLMWPPTR